MKKRKKNRPKRGRRQPEVGPEIYENKIFFDNLVDIVITNDYYQIKLISKAKSAKLKGLRAKRIEKQGRVTQVRTKFKKCKSECKGLHCRSKLKRFQRDNGVPLQRSLRSTCP